MDPAPAPGPASSHPGIPLGGLFVGRGRELAILREAIDAAFEGRGSLVLIAGEAGIGKTALAEVLLAGSAARGALVLVGRCYDLHETPPYGPWCEVFAKGPRDDKLPALPTAVLPPEQAGVMLGSQGAILAQVQAYLAALAARGPLVLLLDDLHWADPASLDLLRAVARHLRTQPVLVVTTYRADEVVTRPTLSALLPALVREARPTQLDLAPLGPEAIEGLVVARYALPAADAKRLTRFLARRSDGNAFFLGEVIRALEEQGGLMMTTAGWRIVDLQPGRVPAIIRQVIRTRLARLEGAGQAALTVAAVIGQEVPIALWQQVSGIAEQELLPLIEQSVAVQILIASEDGTAVRFYHALTRQALYEGLLPPRRRICHRAIGEALAALPAAPADRVAHHFERAGDPRAAAWLVRAGEQAQAAYAYLTAADRYEAALRFMAVGEATGVTSGWLTLRLAWLRFYNEPEQSARRADDVVRLAAEDRELAACALFARGHFRVTSGDFRTGLRDIRAGVAALDALPDGEETWRTALHTLNLPVLEPFHPRGVLTATLAYRGHFAEAREVGERALERASLAEGAGHRVSEMQAYLGLGIAYASLGEPERSRRSFAAARDALRTSTEYLLTSVIDLYELTFPVIMFQTDDVAERRRLVAAIDAAWSNATGTIADDHFVLFADFLLSFLEGRWDELRALLNGAPLTPPVRFFQYAVLGELAHASGDTRTAWRLVREVLPAGAATEPGDGAINTLLAYQRLAATLALDAHDLPAAGPWLEAHDRFLHWSGAVPGRAEGQLGWAAFYRAAGDLPRAIDHATEANALASQPRQPLALLAARRALGQLLVDAGRFDLAGQQLEAALALADACAAPYERALCLVALAELRVATGEGKRAQAALNEARALLEPLAARPALARAEALLARLAAAPARPVAATAAFPGGLSAREVEVLRLVARGLTDAQVADRLTLSRRTVSTHLTNIYTKLGVATRTAAARVAVAHGLD
ncbi:MAG: AAA family ATPase [Chloroflexota bacterium]|nr:AAA family ATPase [Chloroflexota bacterium]